MQLSELIRRFRVQANDKVEPYFNEDQDIKAWLNDAVIEACIRGRLVHESQNSDVCNIAVTSGNSQYALHESLYELTKLQFIPSNGDRVERLQLVSEEFLVQHYGEDWPELSGKPLHAIQYDTSLRLAQTPDQDGTIRIEGYRIPLLEMVSDTDTPVDLNKIHHPYLVEWAMHQAFSIPDTEFFDPNRAEIAERKFSDYFGYRPDSDLRRITRADQPQGTEPFFP